MKYSPLLPLLSFLFCTGCGYQGTARPFNPADLQKPGWVAVPSISLVRQQGEEDCGAASLEMVLRHWNRPADRDRILTACPPKSGEGIRAGDLRDFAKSEGLRAYLLHGELTDFSVELERGHPVIVGLIKPYASGNRSHYEVVVAIRPDSGEVVTLDPAKGWMRNSAEGFLREWDPAGRLTIILFDDP